MIMCETLSDQDLAKLHAHFVLPIVVDNMLQDEEPLDDVAEYAMNEILADLRPDTALLCIAMCARHIANHCGDFPIAVALKIEATKIIEEYGSVWLAYERENAPPDQQALRDLLVYIPEDLECMRDMLEATMDAMEEDHSIAAILCDIMSMQADIHRDLAEIELYNLNLPPQSRDDKKAKETVSAKKIMADNVIMFPVASAAHTR